MTGDGQFDNTTLATRASSYTNTGHDRRRAVRAVASMAVDATECAGILAALGLNPEEGR